MYMYHPETQFLQHGPHNTNFITCDTKEIQMHNSNPHLSGSKELEPASQNYLMTKIFLRPNLS